MALALILLTLAHALAVPAALVLGWGASSGWASPATHLYLALAAVALALFTHSMVLFYFIGTGKTLKEAVQRFGLEPEVLRRVRWFKVQTSGPLTLSCAALIFASTLGGRLLTGQSAWPHLWAGVLAALLNLWTAAREIRAIAMNLALFHELGERVGGLEPDTSPGVQDSGAAAVPTLRRSASSEDAASGAAPAARADRAP
jgi:hypothetical protein